MSPRRAVTVIVLFVCALAATPARAQAPAPDGWVVLPIDEYRSLRSRANPPAPSPVPPPVDATLTRIDYDLSIDAAASPGGADTVAGRALLTLDVLREGWVKVPIPAGLRVRDARLDGQPVALIEGPPAHVVLSTPGRSVLSLEISLPLASSSGAESIALPASTAAVSSAVLVLPRGGVELTVTGGFVSERTESAAASRYVALGRANQPLGFSWKRKADDRRAEQPLRYRARVASAIGLGEELSTITTAVRIEVQQGMAREIVAAVPTGVTINQVNGATVADWDVVAGLLRVRLLDPVGSDASFVAHGEMRLPPDGDVAVPLVRVPGAERETGGVALAVLGAGEIEKHVMRGFETADASELAEVMAGRESPSTAAFRMRPLAGADQRALNVAVRRYTPQAVLIANIEEARYRVLAAEDGVYLIEAHYAIRNNQRSFLKVTLPPGATIWSASVADKPVRPGIAEGDAVLLALEKGRAGEDAPTFVVRITYLQAGAAWADKAAVRLPLPVLDLPISRTGVELHHSPRFRAAAQPGAFRMEADPGVFAEALRPSSPRMGTALAVPAAPHAAGRIAGRDAGLQLLIDRYRNEGGGRTVTGSLPVEVSFPKLGPSVFLAAELTAESAAPAIDLTIRKAK
jgi:hypothetical protein